MRAGLPTISHVNSANQEVCKQQLCLCYSTVLIRCVVFLSICMYVVCLNFYLAAAAWYDGRILKWSILYVTIYGKTRHMEFSIKIEFDAHLISSTIELTCIQADSVLRFGAIALCLRLHHTTNNQEIMV